MQPDPLMQHNPLNPTIHRNDEEGDLDLRIARALEEAPKLHFPEDFAARVVAGIPAESLRLRAARRYARLPARRIGYTVAAACLVLLAIAMLALVRRSTHSTFDMVLESTLAAQFCLLAAWVALPRRS